MNMGNSVFVAGLLCWRALLAACSSIPGKTGNPLVLEDAVKFKTRPEIQAPRWDVHVSTPGLVYPGYWFVSSYQVLDQKNQRGEGWVAPHIYDEHGEVVWSGSYLTQGYDIFDFRISRVLGQDMITMIAPHNRSAFIMDNSFIVRDQIVLAEQGEEVNMHELQFVDDGLRALFFYDRPYTLTDTDVGAVGLTDPSCRIKDSGFRELDGSQSWRKTFDWVLHEHVSIPENTKLPNSESATCPEGWDFAHVNSLDKFPDGSYLMSVRHSDTIYRIGAEGSVIWRLGGKFSDFRKEFNFSRQHDARILEHNATDTIISLFDNATDEDKVAPTSPFSRGLIILLKTAVSPMEAYVLGEIKHPDGWGSYAVARGNMQPLPSGNFLINWVNGLQMSEYTPDGRLIMRARVKQDWLKSYRSYKFSFIGRPTEPPDVYATTVYNPTSRTVHTLVYTSWNGATEVKKWIIYKTNAEGDAGGHRPVAEEPRNGFETFANFKGYATYVVAEAIGKDGSVLGRSRVTETNAYSFIPDEDLVQEAIWLGINPPAPTAKPIVVSEVVRAVEEEEVVFDLDRFRTPFFLGMVVTLLICLTRTRRRFWRIEKRVPRNIQLWDKEAQLD